MKKLVAATMIGLGLLVGGCGNSVQQPTLVQMDNGTYTMSTGDDYGITYLKGYSDDKVTNYKMVRFIGKDVNVATVDDLVKYSKNNGLFTLANIQYIGDAIEYNGNVYKAVTASVHIYAGQKLIVVAKEKDDPKITIDGTFKEFALGEVTKVERDDVGHLTHYTIKVVKSLKSVKNGDVEHGEVDE